MAELALYRKCRARLQHCDARQMSPNSFSSASRVQSVCDAEKRLSCRISVPNPLDVDPGLVGFVQGLAQIWTTSSSGALAT